MTKSVNFGYVMVRKKNSWILEWTFCSLRKDAVYELQKIYPSLTPKELSAKWIQRKAVRTIDLVDYS